MLIEIADLDIMDVKVSVIFLQPPAGGRVAERLKGFAQNIVFVWPDEFGRTRCDAPAEQRAFFENVRYDQLRVQVSRTISLD